MYDYAVVAYSFHYYYIFIIKKERDKLFLIRVNFQIGHELYLISSCLNSGSGTVMNLMDFYCVP